MSHPNRLLHVNLLATFFLALCCHVASIATAHEFAAGEKVLVIRNTSLLSTQENTSPETDVPRGHVFTVKQVRGQEIQCDEKYFGWLSTSDVILGDKAAIEKLTQLIQEEPNNATLYVSRFSLRDATELKEALADLDQAIKLQPIAYHYVKRSIVLACIQDYDRALADCEEARKLEPNYPDLAAMIAYVLCFSGDHEKCIRHCDAILQDSPGDKDIRKYRGIAYFMQKQYQKTIADFDILIQTYPDELAYYRQRASAYIFLERFEAALADSNLLLEKEPRNAENHLLRAKIYLAKGDEEKALIALCVSLSLDPTNLEALTLRADFLVHRKTYKAALEDANRLVELCPTDPKAFLRRASISQNMKASPEIILRDLHEAVRVAPSQIEPYDHRATFHLGQDNYDAAYEDFSAMLRIDPKNAKGLEGLGRVELQRRKFNEAESLLSRSLKINPNSAKACFALGTALLHKNQYEQALPHFSRAVELAPNNIMYHTQLAVCRETTGHTDLAMEGYTHVIDNSMDCLLAYTRRGVIHLQRRQYALALADFNGALELDPKNGEALRERGNAYYFLRSFKLASSDFTAALQSKPKAASILIMRGDCSVHLGELDKAKQDYEACIQDLSNSTISKLAKKRLAKLDNNLKEELEKEITARQTLTIKPAKKEDLFTAAQLHLQGLKKLDSQDLDGASKHFEAALALEPKRIETLKWLGELRIMQKDYDQALVAYSQIIDANPKQAFAYHQRAKVYGALKEYGKANADESKAVELDPTISVVHYEDRTSVKSEVVLSAYQTTADPENLTSRELAEQSLLAKEYDQAITHFDAAIAEDPKSADAFYHRGLAHAELHQTEQALADMQQAETFANDDKNILNGIAWFYATAKDANCRRSAKAIEIATKLCEQSDWKEGRNLGTLAAAHAEAGDFAAAVTRQKDALVNYTAEDRQAFEYLLAVYESGKPYREPEKATVPTEDLNTQTPMYQSSPAEGE